MRPTQIILIVLAVAAVGGVIFYMTRNSGSATPLPADGAPAQSEAGDIASAIARGTADLGRSLIEAIDRANARAGAATRAAATTGAAR